MSKIIDEIKEITAIAVAKKQDAAKLNYPKIIEKIKASAALGLSECRIEKYEMNEYDMELLKKEGFVVFLKDKKRADDYKDLGSLVNLGMLTKEWIISW